MGLVKNFELDSFDLGNLLRFASCSVKSFEVVDSNFYDNGKESDSLVNRFCSLLAGGIYLLSLYWRLYLLIQ